VRGVQAEDVVSRVVEVAILSCTLLCRKNLKIDMAGQQVLSLKIKLRSFLLVYLPLSNDELARMDHCNKDDSSNFDPMRSKRELMMRYCSWFFEKKKNNGIIDDCILSSNTVEMDVNIPLGYIEDFYQNAFRFKNATCGDGDVGSDTREKSNSSGEEMMIDYHTADYYKFARWFSLHCQQHQCIKSEGIVEVSLRRPSSTPWEDCKEIYLPKWKEWQEKEEQRSTPQDLM